QATSHAKTTANTAAPASVVIPGSAGTGRVPGAVPPGGGRAATRPLARAASGRTNSASTASASTTAPALMTVSATGSPVSRPSAARTPRHGGGNEANEPARRAGPSDSRPQGTNAAAAVTANPTTSPAAAAARWRRRPGSPAPSGAPSRRAHQPRPAAAMRPTGTSTSETLTANAIPAATPASPATPAARAVESPRAP